MDLIDQVEDDADPLIVDAKVLLQVLNEVRPRDVGVGELLSGRVLARNQPFFFDPYLQRFDFKAGADLPLERVEGAGLVPRIDLQLIPTCIGQCHIIALEFQCLSRQIWRARHQRSEFATFEAPPEGIWLALLGIRS